MYLKLHNVFDVVIMLMINQSKSRLKLWFRVFSFRTLLILHPEMKPLLTPHSSTFSTTNSTSLSLPLVPRLIDLGFHLACLQVASYFTVVVVAIVFVAFPSPALFKLVPKDGENQKKLSPWLKKDIMVIKYFSKTIFRNPLQQFASMAVESTKKHIRHWSTV